jgi:HAD superfamily hydrolase (TIGR01509 family)
MYSLRDVTNVLFDLDGTLVDSTASVHDAFKCFALACGANPDPSVLARFDGLSTYEIVDRAIQAWHVDLPVEAVRTKYFSLLARAYEKVKPADSAYHTLSTLRARGRTLGLVTSASRELTYGLLDRLGWRQIFELIVCSEPDQKGKPHPEPYRAALRSLCIRPENAIAVEDSINGIRSARAAGLRVVAIAQPHARQIMLDAGAIASMCTVDGILNIIE